MNFKDYQSEAAKTAIYPSQHKGIYPVLGLTGEAGEVAEKVKKLIRDKKGIADEEFKAMLEKELGDVLWYISAIATDYGLSLNKIAENNILKLLDRQKRNVLQGSGDNR